MSVLIRSLNFAVHSWMQIIVLNGELKFLAVSSWIDPQARLYSKQHYSTTAKELQGTYAKVG